MEFNITSEPVNCSEGFYYDRLCKPDCRVFTLYSKATALVSDILSLLPAVIGTVAGIAVLIVSWARRQHL